MLSLSEYASVLLVNMDRGKPLSYVGYEYLLRPLEDPASRIVIQKAAQVGATVMATVRALWFVDVARMHVLYLFPTHATALRFSRGRLRVLIESSPYLRRRFRQVRRENHLRAGSVNFYCHGGRSRAELMSIPVQSLTVDERDEMYVSRPDKPQPWSAVDLARQRLSGQERSWELTLSTPTIPDHGIAADFAHSDQHNFYPRCPQCERYVRLTWPDAIRLEPLAGGKSAGEEEGLAETRRWQAEFCCPACRRSWSSAQRRQAIAQGVWIADYPQRDLRGYQLTQLLSPTQTAARLFRAWEEAQGTPARLQVFHNSVLGTPYVAEGARLDASFIEAAQVRDGGLMAEQAEGAVMGVDVGASGFHVVIAQPHEALLRLLWVGVVRDWDELARLARRFQVACYVLDAMPETHAARAFLRLFPQGYLCWYTRAGQNVAVDHNARTVQAPRTDSLDAMYLRWRLGKVTAPGDVPRDFAAHLTSLVRVVRLNRFGELAAEYVAAGPDHYAHAMNYCELAAGLRPRPVRFELCSAGTGRPSWQA